LSEKKIGDPIGIIVSFNCPYCNEYVMLKPKTPIGIFEFKCKCEKISTLFITEKSVKENDIVLPISGLFL